MGPADTDAVTPPGTGTAPPPEVSVVVLSWNSARFVPGCMQSLSRTKGVAIEVIHVDNASSDDSDAAARRWPVVSRAIRNESNLGFGGGNDVGWRLAGAPVIVFLNPDCLVRHDTIAVLRDTLLSDPAIGIVGAKLLYPGTRTIQHAGGVLHPNAMAEHPGVGEEDGPRFDARRDVDYVTGALFAIRRGDVESLGGFDADYFPAYYEETDWCERLRRQGRRVVYEPRAVAWHHESVGLGKKSDRLVRMSYRNRIRFVIKNYTVVELLTRFLPFELSWFAGAHSRGYRMAAVASWVSGLAFAARCLARMSRRPR